MNIKLHNEIFARLIQIGRSEDFSQLESLSPPAQRHSLRYKLMLGSEECKRLARSLTDEDLVALIKALTVLGANVPGLSFGSVSPVIWLFHQYASRSEGDTLTNWILSHSKNRYLPWGRVGCCAKTLAEFHNWEFEKHQRHARAVAQEADRQRVAHKLKQRREQEAATRNLANAVRRSDVGAVAALLKKGADVSAPNQYGKSVKELAIEKGNEQIIQMLGDFLENAPI